MTPKQFARIGVFHLEEAILEVLFQADSEYMRTTDITRAIGIKSFDNWDWIVGRLLRSKLEEDGRVESRRSERGTRTGWKLTTREYNRRADISG